MTIITVLKLNHEGKELTRYTGDLLSQTPTSICIQAIFQRPRAGFSSAHGLTWVSWSSRLATA